MYFSKLHVILVILVLSEAQCRELKGVNSGVSDKQLGRDKAHTMSKRKSGSSVNYHQKIGDCWCRGTWVRCSCGCAFFFVCCESCACFAGDARLTLDDGKLLQMKDLSVGQSVLTVQDGKRIFSEVKTFLKRQPSTNSTYLTLTTENGNHVTMSGDHIIFVSTNNVSTNLQSRYASSVKPGDYIFSTSTCSSGLCPERVAQVSTSHKQGVYVPLTDAGTIVVDGIFASCYTSYQHDISHLVMTPFRWFPWLLEPWQEDGYSPIIPMVKYVGNFILPRMLTEVPME